MPNVDTKAARKSCSHWKTFSSLIVYRQLCYKIQKYLFPTIISASLHHVKKKIQLSCSSFGLDSLPALDAE